MPSAELSRRVEKVVGYPPLSEIGDLQRRECLVARHKEQDLSLLPTQEEQTATRHLPAARAMAYRGARKHQDPGSYV